MSLLADDKVTRFKFGDDWIDVLSKMPYGVLQPIIAKIDHDNEMANSGMILDILRIAIKAWSEDVPCSSENIAKLPSDIVTELTPKVIELYMPEKKN